MDDIFRPFTNYIPFWLLANSLIIIQGFSVSELQNSVRVPLCFRKREAKAPLLPDGFTKNPIKENNSPSSQLYYRSQTKFGAR